MRHSRRAGWQHLHVAVDDHAWLAYAEVLPTDQKPDAVAFLERALGWFAASLGMAGGTRSADSWRQP